jgi:predicted nucleotidyltransferase
METTLDRALAALRARSQDLQARGLLHVAVFGSVARREDGPDSDLDLVVDVGPEVGTLDVMVIEEFLAEEFGRKVQIITKSGLDKVRHAEIFRDMTPVF